MSFARTALIGMFLGSFAACGGGGGGGGSSATPCDQLTVQCDECVNTAAQARCYQAVNLGLDSTCQQLLDSGTYSSTGVECR